MCFSSCPIRSCREAGMDYKFVHQDSATLFQPGKKDVKELWVSTPYGNRVHCMFWREMLEMSP